MKKYILALLFLPSIAMATDTNNMTVTGRVITQRMDVSTISKAVQIGFIDGSTQTTAGYVRFKDEGVYFMAGSTIDCVGTAITCSDAGNGVTQINVSASGGGGGGGGGAAIFTGAASVSFSTQSFPGATITSDGNGFSTVTYMPAINSTFTALTSTGVSLSRLWTVTLSTWNTFVLFTSTTQSGFELFKVQNSTTDSSLDAIRSSITVNFTSLNSTWTFLNLFTSTTQADLDLIRSSVTLVRQSTATAEVRFNTFASTATAQDETFKGWFSSNSSINDLQNSSGTALAQTVSQRTVVGYDEGSALSGGNVTAINWTGTAVTATQSNSTITVNVTGSGGGGSPPSLQNPTTGIHNLQSDAGTRYGIANSTGIELGQNLQLTTWMSTVSAPITQRVQWAGFGLIALSTDFAPTLSTTSIAPLGGGGSASLALNPHLAPSFSEASTDTRRGFYVVPNNIALSSTVVIGFVVRASSGASGKNVQMLFRSSGTLDGQVYNMVNSTGVDSCALSATAGQQSTFKVEVPVNSGTGNLGWSPGMFVYFEVVRNHDTAKLTTTDLPARLSLLSFYMDIPLLH